MINNIVLSIVRAFIERQVIKFGKAIDWRLVKTDLDIRIRQIVPGEMYDVAAVLVSNTIVDLIAAYFATAELPEGASDTTSKILDQAFTAAQNGIMKELASRLK